MSSSKRIKVSDVHGNYTYVDIDEIIEFYKNNKNEAEKLKKQIEEAEIELQKERDEKQL